MLIINDHVNDDDSRIVATYDFARMKFLWRVYGMWMKITAGLFVDGDRCIGRVSGKAMDGQ